MACIREEQGIKNSLGLGGGEAGEENHSPRAGASSWIFSAQRLP